MPYSNLALDADRENGPAARSFAADAHDRIMVRIKRSYRIQVCDTKMHPMASSPRIPLHRQAPAGARSYAKSPIAGDGTKNGFPAPNKEPSKNQNDYLTGKAPYRFESTSLRPLRLDFTYRTIT